jgi:hypothetical protein
MFLKQAMNVMGTISDRAYVRACQTKLDGSGGAIGVVNRKETGRIELESMLTA